MMNENLYGLVLCGGKSSRMGEDKGLINYTGSQERVRMYYMLGTVCRKVYLSTDGKYDQAKANNFPVIIDNIAYHNSGPIAGLLSAHDAFPEKDFLCTGCDYPLLNREDLISFKTFSAGYSLCTFYDDENDVYIPMLGFYSSACLEKLKKYFNEGNTSLQKFLKENNAGKYIADSDSAILNVNTPAEKKAMLFRLKQS